MEMELTGTNTSVRRESMDGGVSGFQDSGPASIFVDTFHGFRPEAAP